MLHNPSYHIFDIQLQYEHYKKEIDYNQVLVLLEATGGYEKPVVKWLVAHHVPVSIINAKRVRDFAKSSGEFAKNERDKSGRQSR